MGRIVFVLSCFLLAACSGPDAIRANTGDRPVVDIAHAAGHQEGTFSGWNGTSLFEQWWRPAAETRAVLIVQHGLKDYGGRYAPLADALNARGIAVYAMDLPGHGRSGGDRAYVHYFEEYLADFEMFFARVSQREPGRPIFLFGHSMGGAIVTRFVMTRQPYVHGAILSGAALQVTPDVSGFLVRVTRSVGRILPHARVLDLPNHDFSRDPAVVRAMDSDPLIEQRQGPARTAAQLLIQIQAIQEHMEDVHVPLLILHGTSDRLTNPEGSRALYLRAQSPDKTLHLYPGLYHDLLHEPERAEVLNDITTWLDARIPTGT
jgi:alpha-beta hydrolase superfamily lysophospholipase